MRASPWVGIKANVKELLLTIFIESSFRKFHQFVLWTGLIVHNLTFVYQQLIILSFSVDSVKSISRTTKTAKTWFCRQIKSFKTELYHLIYSPIHFLTSYQNLTWFLWFLIMNIFPETVSNCTKYFSNARWNGSNEFWRVTLMKNLNFHVLTN